MAKIKPFKAVIYNREKISDLAKVVCPPYDIISGEAQVRFHNRHPNNLIHILLGNDIPGEDKYCRAANFFNDWLKKQILIRDITPAIYFYSQQYHIKGETKTRLGFISLLALPEKDSSVFAHEHTRLAPKEDRFKLIKQLKANLSPIFAVFLDHKRIIQRVYQRYIQNKEPFIDICDEDKTRHKLWRIDSQDIIDSMQRSMSGEDIFIADGHHRYEVACMYRQEMIKKLGAVSGEEDFNYVLTYFTNTDYRGLSILPIHRLLRLEKSLDLENFITKLQEYFDIDEIKDKTRFFFLMEKGGRAEHVLGIYKDKRFLLLRLKNIKTLDKLMSDKPKEYRSLDVAMLNAIVLKDILGVNFQDHENLTYGPDAEEFIVRCDESPLKVAFFLNPVKMEQIIQVALKGEKMPPKSTYFYPKVLSGLVINKFE